MSELANKIENMVTQKPGIKATQIASALGKSRKVINREIYKFLKRKLIQDEKYKWYPISYDESIISVEEVRKSESKIGSFRGQSLFKVSQVSSGIQITYNSKHLFFSEQYSELDTQSRQCIDLLLSSFSNVVLENYDLLDEFEEIIESWGKLLQAAIKKL
jgi:hypothetical protein